MKFKKIILIFILLSIFLLTGLFLYLFNEFKKKVNIPYSRICKQTILKKITIKRGMNGKSVGRLLEKNQIISNRYVFLLWLYINNLSSHIKAGEYELSNNKNIKEITKILVEAKVVLYKLTIPEGLTFKEIADIIEQKKFGSSKLFIDLCKDKNFIYKLTGKSYSSLEGFLYPETYNFPKNSTEKDIIETMYKCFYKFTHELFKNNSDFFLDKYEIMRLASIVEAEAVFKEEKDRIAGVYINRLKRNMKLEADPTVQYAHGYHRKRLLYKDLKIDSKYNTYLYPGLPPTPICNFSYDTIKSVYNYEKHKYYYFVADVTGKHIFSSTVRQHNYNKRLIKRKRRRR